jgi:uncharacterized protein YndB with AHSA1/START domain
MHLGTSGWRRAFALLVIGHGLAHTVLPLRGWLNPALFGHDFMPHVLYAVAVMGFTIAGIGLLGVTPFTAAVRPLLVLGSGYSLVAIWVFGAGDLWWGAALDVVLLFTGLTGLYRRLPIGERHGPWPHRIAVSAATAFLLYVTCALALWPVYRLWGSQPSEFALALPGDSSDRRPGLELQHAVTVNAPPEAVWPWLVQLGQDRAGFYSYDWLERAFGADVHNVTEIRPEWQQRQAGDRVRATQANYLGGVLGEDLGWTVTDLEPGRAMVLQHWGAFVLRPTEDGRTRFIIRTKVGDSGTKPWTAALDMLAFELPHFIMERKMMLQIKALAEQQHVPVTSAALNDY